MPERCPSCGTPTYGAGIGENMDGTTFVYCSCGYILSGEEKED